MDLITVDKDKCLKCGVCADICPACILTMGEEGPECHFDRGCMSCGQCVAICPMGALDNKYTPKEKQTPITKPVLDSETAYHFLRSRRSVRNFKPEPPSEELITDLLNVSRYAPTAGNTQGLNFIVIRDKDKIAQIAEVCANWMQDEIDAGTENKRYFLTVLRAYRERGKDIICRNSPCLIFAIARRLNITAVSNAEQTWAYANLYAPTIGLGSTTAGFLQACGTAGYKPLYDILDIPGKFTICGALMVGYPKYKYQRMPERQHLKVEFK